MPTGGTQALSTTPATLFTAESDGEACEEFYVANDAASANVARVTVTPLHQSGEAAQIPPGVAIPFRCKRGVTSVVADVAAGSATIYYGVNAR
jgi:hypothetical protein